MSGPLPVLVSIVKRLLTWRPYVLTRVEYGVGFRVGRYRTLEAAQAAAEVHHRDVDVPPIYWATATGPGKCPGEWEWAGPWQQQDDGSWIRDLVDEQAYVIERA